MPEEPNPEPPAKRLTPAKGGKPAVAVVTLLDGKTLEVNVERKSKGEKIFDEVCDHLDLQEKDYFGLSFRDKAGRRTWLDLDKRIGKVLKGDSWNLDFEVKFYPKDPSQLQEDITRYLLCLQVRNDILSGKLPCSFVTHAMLGSYLVQSELGDYSPDDYPDSSYLSKFKFCPKPAPGLEEKVMTLHKAHKGQTPAEAELHYLENAKKLAMYGVDLHPAKDSEGVDIQLGVCSTGLLVYRDMLRINRFAWPKILKISYRRNNFYIKIRPGEFEQYESTIGFKLDSSRAAKNLWKVCVDQHTFFRLMSADSIKRPGLFPRLGSLYRWNRKTQVEVLDSSLNPRPEQNFQRSHSCRPSKSLDALGQQQTNVDDPVKRHTMSHAPPRPAIHDSPVRLEKGEESSVASMSSTEGEFSTERSEQDISAKKPAGGVAVLPMEPIKKKILSKGRDNGTNGVTTNETEDDEKENRSNLDDASIPIKDETIDKKKQSPSHGLKSLFLSSSPKDKKSSSKEKEKAAKEKEEIEGKKEKKKKKDKSKEKVAVAVDVDEGRNEESTKSVESKDKKDKENPLTESLAKLGSFKKSKEKDHKETGDKKQKEKDNKETGDKKQKEKDNKEAGDKKLKETGDKKQKEKENKETGDKKLKEKSKDNEKNESPEGKVKKSDKMSVFKTDKKEKKKDKKDEKNTGKKLEDRELQGKVSMSETKENSEIEKDNDSGTLSLRTQNQGINGESDGLVEKVQKLSSSADFIEAEKTKEENHGPKIVMTTTKSHLVSSGGTITQNIEEKVEDLDTGEVTHSTHVNTAEGLDESRSPFTATTYATRMATTREDLGTNAKTSQVEEKVVATSTTTSGLRQEQRVVTQEVRATTVVNEPQLRRNESSSSMSSDDYGTPIDVEGGTYYVEKKTQGPIVETEAVLYKMEPSVDESGEHHTPLVPTVSQRLEDGTFQTPGAFVSSQYITSKTRTVETLTYKTEKDGVVETRVEQKITIQSDGDPIDHDKALAEAIQEATAMNPDMRVEKIEIQQEALP